MGALPLFDFNPSKYEVLVCVGDSFARKHLIGDFLSMMPNSVISGNCVVGDNVYFGTNSSTKEKVKVCSNVILGLNSGVVKNIVESGIYVGTPAKKNKTLTTLKRF